MNGKEKGNQKTYRKYDKNKVTTYEKLNETILARTKRRAYYIQRQKQIMLNSLQTTNKCENNENVTA